MTFFEKGWGLAHELAQGTTRLLQKAQIPVIPIPVCQNWTDISLTEKMIWYHKIACLKLFRQ